MSTAVQPRIVRSRSDERTEREDSARRDERQVVGRGDEVFDFRAQESRTPGRVAHASSAAAVSLPSMLGSASPMRSHAGAVRVSSRITAAARVSALPKPARSLESRPKARSVAERTVSVKAKTGIRARKRTTIVPIVIAMVALVLSIVGTMSLHMVMIEDSFELTRVEQTNTQLRQDIENDQLQIDQQSANLPNKATDLGMQPGSDSVTLDMGNDQ
ncbi:MAG: hypothetical protein PUF97_04620 [Bifidobacteriaceae bacterium]|nr:hypothetical protein [Bifidobacteriaceae bacterium]